MAGTEALFEPFRLKHLVIRNRVMSTSHAPAYDEDGMPGTRYQAYHEEKAKGGIGLSMFGGSSGISHESKVDWGKLSLATDAIVPYLQILATRVRRHGAKLMIQLAFMGKKIEWDNGLWVPPQVPSKPKERWHALYGKEMED